MNTQSNTAFSLLALAIGAFAIGTTEFSPMGLLPNIANDLGISIPTAGMLITGYALGVMLGAPFMTLWFGGFARRNALIFLMAIFTVGNLIAAFSPNYMKLIRCTSHYKAEPRCLFRNWFCCGSEYCTSA